MVLRNLCHTITIKVYKMDIFSIVLIVCALVLIFGSMKANKSQPKEKYDYNVWFDRANDSVAKAIEFLSRLQADEKLCSFIESQKSAVLRLNGKTITYPREKLRHLFLMDLAKCYEIMNYSPAGSNRRSIPMLLFYSKLTDPEVSITVDTLLTYREHCQDSFDKIMGQIGRSVKNGSDIFYVAEYLKHYNKDLLSEYVRVVLSFGYSVAGAEGKVSEKDEQALDRIFNYQREICI